MKKKWMVCILTGILYISALSACGNADRGRTEAASTVPTSVTQSSAADSEAAKRAQEADACYEAGRALLYGLNGQAIDYAAAYDNFEQALAKGKNEANFYLGLLNDWYSYPKQNFEKAKSYYEAAGENPYAKLALGFLYYNGQGVSQDAAKARGLFDAVVAAGCVEGYLGHAGIAMEEQDYASALEYYTKAEGGQEPLYTANAMSNIGWLYHAGLGVTQDFARAMAKYEKAAALGNTDAMNNIGWLYENGLGVAKEDAGKAMEWYEKAAALGNADAMNNIGWLYGEGLGVAQDYVKAMEWYEKAAALEYVDAMQNIGWMYQEGLGVAKDYAKAMEWYEKAAALGSVSAMNTIGWMYGEGRGVAQDYAKAMEWHQKAADLGDANAMQNIGWLYENGMGVGRDAAKAQEWYAKAKAAGYGSTSQ